MIFVEGFDHAILGVAHVSGKPVVVYDEDKIIFGLMQEMSEDEAIDQYMFNIINAFNGEGMPIVIAPLTREQIEDEYGINKKKGRA